MARVLGQMRAATDPLSGAKGLKERAHFGLIAGKRRRCYRAPKYRRPARRSFQACHGEEDALHGISNPLVVSVSASRTPVVGLAGLAQCQAAGRTAGRSAKTIPDPRPPETWRRQISPPAAGAVPPKLAKSCSVGSTPSARRSLLRPLISTRSRPILTKRAPVQISRRKILWGTKQFCRGDIRTFQPEFCPFSRAGVVAAGTIHIMDRNTGRRLSTGALIGADL
jgi:hypothetical protein